MDNMNVEKVVDTQALYKANMQSKYPYIMPPKGYKWAKIIERKQLSFNEADGITVFYRV